MSFRPTSYHGGKRRLLVRVRDSALVNFFHTWQIEMLENKVESKEMMDLNAFHSFMCPSCHCTSSHTPRWTCWMLPCRLVTGQPDNRDREACSSSSRLLRHLVRTLWRVAKDPLQGTYSWLAPISRGQVTCSQDS